ncbi:TetR/AcrR family transcriptional regulator [Actinocorallia libanotica]|uniref:TetR family transcriptional regulator KstR2 n=1 Tax=Actinocorallia libanotica TaxID=46162 RepID=A0ABN1QE37_9ACTN
MCARRRDAEGTAATRASRRAELLSAIAGVFADRGYAATTVREAAEAAGILGGSLYYHFDSKESMVDEILSTFLGEMWADYEEVLSSGLDAPQTLRALVHSSFRSIEKHRAAVVIYQNESRYLAQAERFQYLTASQERFERTWKGVLEQGVAEGAFRADLNTGLIYRFIRDTVWVAATWYRPDGKFDAEEIARQYLAMVLEGLQAD